MSSKADQRNPSRIHIPWCGFGPPSGLNTHGDGVSQATWTHHCVLRVSSPWMGLSVGVGLGRGKACRLNALPVPVVLTLPVTYCFSAPLTFIGSRRTVAVTRQKHRSMSVPTLVTGMGSHGPAVLAPKISRADLTGTKPQFICHSSCSGRHPVLKTRPDVPPYFPLYLHPLS